MEGDVYIKLKLVTVELESKLLFICKVTFVQGVYSSIDP